MIMPNITPTKTSFALWCLLICSASCTMSAENPKVTRNIVEVNPSVSPTDVLKALTNAECALGMPPSSKKAFFFLEIKILNTWHNSQALIALITMNFIPVAFLLLLQHSLALLFLILSLCRLLLLPADVALLRLLQNQVFCLGLSFLMP